MYKWVQTLRKRIVFGNIVKQLEKLVPTNLPARHTYLCWTSQSELRINDQVGDNCSKPFGLWNHIGIQSSHVVRRASWKIGREFQTMIQISSFEMVWNAWYLLSGGVENVQIQTG